jgi:hypothetical protein
MSCTAPAILASHVDTAAHAVGVAGVRSAHTVVADRGHVEASEHKAIHPGIAEGAGVCPDARCEGGVMFVDCSASRRVRSLRS